MGFACSSQHQPKSKRPSSGIVTITMLAAAFFLGVSHTSIAQTLPGPADAGRIEPERKILPPNRADNVPAIQGKADPVEAADGAEKVKFILNDLLVEGVTAFPKSELKDIYKPYLGQEISLKTIYDIANKITQRYKDEGYFLSLAYIPDQKISDGIVTIKIVEGYVAEVDVQPSTAKNYVIDGHIKKLLEQKPLKSSKMESFLLRLNDLPGYTFRAVLSPIPGSEAGSVKLTLIPGDESGRGVISADNYASRFLGPNQVTASYETSLIKLHQTSVTLLSTVPPSELRYGTIRHSVAIAPDITLGAMANTTRARPGYTLEPLEIESDSKSWSLDAEWQYIRQRNTNLSLNASLNWRNSSTDFLNTPITRDKVRSAKLGFKYDLQENWFGYAYNTANVVITHGLPGLGSTKENDPNLSRAEAKPDFTKAEATLERLQSLPENFSLVGRLAGQVASGALYSSEEFGYGGQFFGRAYDASEMTGDHGISGSLELRYNGFTPMPQLSLMPYAFYDIGAVWNEDLGQAKKQSGASAGLGVRAESSFGISANAALAWALTDDVATPIHQLGEDGPRILFSLSKQF